MHPLLRSSCLMVVEQLEVEVALGCASDWVVEELLDGWEEEVVEVFFLYIILINSDSLYDISSIILYHQREEVEEHDVLMVEVEEHEPLRPWSQKDEVEVVEGRPSH